LNFFSSNFLVLVLQELLSSFKTVSLGFLAIIHNYLCII
jgi:hypothetical protein